MLQHKHLIVRAEVAWLPDADSPAVLRMWIKKLISKINMKLLSGPHVAYVDVPGNVGWTGVAIIETSHIAIHTWSEPIPKLIQLDVYSCADFAPETVLEALEFFGLMAAEYTFLDRENTLKTLSTGVLMEPTSVSDVDIGPAGE